MVVGAVAVAGLAVVQADATPVMERPLTVSAQDTLGKQIFQGKGTCFACHGQDAKGTALAPDLTDDEWLNGDGTLASVSELVKTGVPSPKQFPAPMPPMGGAQLTDAEVQAVAQYVVSLSPES
jgi:cbb3-type cytochrome c oxidase subunit III